MLPYIWCPKCWSEAMRSGVSLLDQHLVLTKDDLEWRDATQNEEGRVIQPLLKYSLVWNSFNALNSFFFENINILRIQQSPEFLT